MMVLGTRRCITSINLKKRKMIHVWKAESISQRNICIFAFKALFPLFPEGTTRAFFIAYRFIRLNSLNYATYRQNG